MKKIICIVMLALLIISISSCDKTVEVTRYEEQPKMIGGGFYIGGNVANEITLKYYSHIMERNESLEHYIPREGSFTTNDGETFISSVKENSMIFTDGTSHKYELYFTLEIYSEENELIVSEQIRCLNGIDPDVSDEMLKYWNCVKVSSKEYFENP